MNWWQYLILVNIYLVLFYGFYALLLRRETFFQLNRIYLVSAAMLSFFIPLIQAGWVRDLFITQEVKYSIYGNAVVINGLKPVEAIPFNIGQVLGALYLAGVLFLTLRLVWQLFMLNRIINKNKPAEAYSFFKKIKLDEQVSNSDIIAAHEQVHARQWHSADVLIIEAVMIINWFNPVVYFYRRAIKHIHEFIADDHIVETAANKADYALLLLNQTFNPASHGLVNNFFNHSLLKQRIIMLQKNKSQRIALIKYGLSAPLFILMLVLSSATVNNSSAIKTVNKVAQKVFALPADTSIITKINLVTAPGEPQKITTINLTYDKPGKKTDSTQKREITISDVKVVPTIIDTPTEADKSQVFTAVEVEPTYPGGQAKFSQFLAQNVRYPKAMLENNIKGRVIVTFIVEKDGSLSNVKALRGPGYGAEEEAIRAVMLSPKWNPGTQNGKQVRVQFTMPVNFQLEGNLVGISSAWTNDTSRKAVRLIRINGKDNQALVVVDGKDMSMEDLKTLDVNTIQSITVLKDKSAVDLYGAKATNGVILVTTKKK